MRRHRKIQAPAHRPEGDAHGHIEDAGAAAEFSRTVDDAAAEAAEEARVEEAPANAGGPHPRTDTLTQEAWVSARTKGSPLIQIRKCPDEMAPLEGLEILQFQGKLLINDREITLEDFAVKLIGKIVRQALDEMLPRLVQTRGHRAASADKAVKG